MLGSSADQSVRVAVIDTDSGHLQVLAKRMEGLGWQYRVSGGPLPLSALVSMRLNALVVDLAVLGPDAWTYLDQVCTELPGLAVVVCSGPSSVAQRVRALRLGADDWLGKPCHPEELAARIEAVVRRRRRSETQPAAAPVAAGELEIRTDQFQAFAKGTSVQLTRREFELLALLAAAQGQVLPREEIYQRVWGYAMAHGDRSVDVFVRKVRQKLEKGSPGWRYIHTHFGVGYRFAAERDGVDAGAGEIGPAPAPATQGLPAAEDRVPAAAEDRVPATADDRVPVGAGAGAFRQRLP